MDYEKIKKIEEALADLKARWPAHSVKPEMWQQLEELEENLARAKAEQNLKEP
ncbi:histidine kinase [Chloroflexota bacterium]